ncbi:MAG TPA: hypothetical protein VHJ76_01235 [Actinomycetota bacterium]|nr:hypothetical protein [Actinomycetota bacterium]
MTLLSNRRLAGIVLCAALVSGLLVTGRTALAADCETVWLPVYDLEVEVGRDVYHFGDTARVDVTVTHTDTGTAVEDASVLAYVPYFENDGFVAGWDRTDASGHAVAYLELKRKHLRPGPTKLRVIGMKTTSDPTTCVQVVEYGEVRLRKAFTVKP